MPNIVELSQGLMTDYEMDSQSHTTRLRAGQTWVMTTLLQSETKFRHVKSGGVGRNIHVLEDLKNVYAAAHPRRHIDP